MAKHNPDEEDMTVDITLDDGTSVSCEVVTILEVEGQDYIVLLPTDNDVSEGEVWIYRYAEDPDDPNVEPILEYIEDDDEYEVVADAFDEFMDSQEFDELAKDDEE